MFTLDTLRKEATETSFLRGKTYYRNNRIKKFAVKEIKDGLYEISASIRGSQYYNTRVSIDNEDDKLVEWRCSCPYDYGGICKHVVAAGMKFLKERDEIVVHKSNNNNNSSSILAATDNPKSWIDNSLESMIYDNLGLTPVKFSENINKPNKFKIVFNEFNIDGALSSDSDINQTQAARSRRFSVKVLYEDGKTQKNVRIDRDMVREVGGAYSLFLEYIITNGVFVDGLYYLGQLNIDVMFSFAQELDEVMFGNPPRTIEITGSQYKPEIELISRTDGSVTLAFQKGMDIIPGKYSVFILKDNKIMKLNDNIPWSFISKVQAKTTIGPELHGKLMENVVPVLKNAFEIKKTSQLSKRADNEQDIVETPIKIVSKDIDPEITIFIKHEKETDTIYVVPEISYEDYLSINPFDKAEARKYKNLNGKFDLLLQNVKIGNEIIQFGRNLSKEHQVCIYLNDSMNIKPDENGRLSVISDQNLFHLFNHAIPNLPKEWKIFYDKGLENIKLYKENISCDFDFLAKTDSGLLEFDAEFHCGNLKISMDQLDDYIRKNKKLLKIDGNFVEITNKDELGKLFNLLENFNKKDKAGSYSGKLYQALELDEFIENSNRYSYKSNENYKRLIHETKDFKLYQQVKIPKEFIGVLRNYQIDGIQWMHFLREYGFGGILADDMGLGKTLQVLVMLYMTSIAPDKKPSIIICPKTLIHNWHNEIKRFVPSLKVLIACGGSHERIAKIKRVKGYDVVITSYPLVQKDIEAYRKVDFEYCILDEAQFIKNPLTITAKSVKALNSKNRLALTGTPVENNLTDLWSIFDFVMPGFLGKESSFKSKYGNINPQDQDDNNTLKNLNKMIKPFILRRTKLEMLKDLPPKIEQIGFSELKTDQLALYTKMLEKIRGDIYGTISEKGFKNSQIEILAGLTRLRQICNHPGLINEKLIETENVSGKIELFEKLINKCQKEGHRVLVFSQFVKMLNILGKFLDKRNIRYTRLDGQSRNREDIINTFNTDETISVFLISLKAGGFGLNLTSADTVIIFDPWWNPMAEDQASDRVHRIGQNKLVNVYRLITKGTVEEKIQKLQERKRALFDSVVNETGDVFKKLSLDDLKDILE